MSYCPKTNVLCQFPGFFLCQFVQGTFCTGQICHRGIYYKGQMSCTRHKIVRSATAADFQEFDFQACLDSTEREILTFAKLRGNVTSANRMTVIPREFPMTVKPRECLNL